jgi:hypothetical protein
MNPNASNRPMSMLERPVLTSGAMTTQPIKQTALLLIAAALAFGCSKPSEPSTTSTVASAPSPATSAAPRVVATTDPFEGEITVTVKDEAQQKLAPSITYSVKGNNVRYVPAAAPVRAVSDLAAQRVSVIDDAQKSYETIDGKAVAGAKVAPAPKVQKTGKMEKLAGLDCEDWTIDDGNEKVDVCAAKNVAYFALAGDAKPGNTETPWATALTSEKAFPLRVVVHDKAGKEAYRAEATKADRKKLDDALFQVPPTYKKADLAKEAKTASLP